MRRHSAAALVRFRIYWRLILATIAVTVAVDTVLYFGQQTYRDRAVELVTSAYDRARNPDFPAEAVWKAMSWEQKRANRQRFEEGLVLRKFRSEQLLTEVGFMQTGFILTGLIGIAIVVMALAGGFEGKEPSRDSASQS